MIDGLAVARAVHVVAIVHWIGGLLFVTLVILPSLLETEAPRRLAVFDALERRFATQARLSTLLVGLSGFYMLYAYEHLNRKRKWLFNTVRELSEFSANASVVPRFMTGSKIPYRGRRLSLTVRRHDGPHVEITFRNGFIVDLPSWVALESADAIVAQEIKQWLKQRVRRDVREIAEVYIDRFGLKP